MCHIINLVNSELFGIIIIGCIMWFIELHTRYTALVHVYT